MILNLSSGVSRVELRIVTDEGVTPVVNVFHPPPPPHLAPAPIPAKPPAPASMPRPRLLSSAPWSLVVAGGFAALTFGALAAAAIVLPLRQAPSTLSMRPGPTALQMGPIPTPTPDLADVTQAEPPSPNRQEPHATAVAAMPRALARELARPPVVTPPPGAPAQAAVPAAPDGQAHGGNLFGLD